jgi:CII-binding regulator of phage lambda lysogenization HflD
MQWVRSRRTQVQRRERSVLLAGLRAAELEPAAL